MPTDSSNSGPASVPATIVNGAGGDVDWKTKCKEIYAQFDPPIETGSYEDLKKRREADPDRYRNVQFEHMVPNSNCILGSGRSGTPVPGLPGYTPGGGFCYTVFDNQHLGTEHKLLTDLARQFSGKSTGEGVNWSLSKWLEEGQKNAEKTLKDNAERKTGESERSRTRSEAERDELCKKAAECLRREAEEHFQPMKKHPEADPILQNGYHKNSSPSYSGNGTESGV